MTDGAGYITRRLLQRLTLLHDWPSRPSAIQVRVLGSKVGKWIFFIAQLDEPF